MFYKLFTYVCTAHKSYCAIILTNVGTSFIRLVTTCPYTSSSVGICST